MSTDEYVPSEAHFRDYYVGGRSEYDPEYTDDMAARRDWGTFLARVRRDAAREALDGLAAAEHRATRAEAQSAIRGRAVAIYRERARQAEAERDLWWRKWCEAEERAVRAEWLLDEAYAGARPLAPGGITDEMVERARKAGGLAKYDSTLDTIRRMLTAALTEPPARPEGAEDIEAYMRELVASHPEDHYGELADHLASRGVLPPLTDKTNPARVVTEEMNR